MIAQLTSARLSAITLYQDNSLASPVHFCLDGQGNQPELMSSVLVLVFPPPKKGLNLKQRAFTFPEFSRVVFYPAQVCLVRHLSTERPAHREQSGWKIEKREKKKEKLLPDHSASVWYFAVSSSRLQLTVCFCQWNSKKNQPKNSRCTSALIQMSHISIPCPTCCLNNTACSGNFLPLNYWFLPVGMGNGLFYFSCSPVERTQKKEIVCPRGSQLHNFPLINEEDYTKLIVSSLLEWLHRQVSV